MFVISSTQLFSVYIDVFHAANPTAFVRRDCKENELFVLLAESYGISYFVTHENRAVY
jgi:hypothetical protein